jgi:replicative DNA helicase
MSANSENITANSATAISAAALAQRLPPQNQAAEKALLGALLANNKAYEQVSEFLLPEHFAEAMHGNIYNSIRRRIEAGQVADVITIRGDFERSGQLDAVGGAAYLVHLLTSMVGLINAGEYGRVIHDCWIRRQIVGISEEMHNKAFSDAEMNGTEQVEAAEQSMFELASFGAEKGGFVSLSKAIYSSISQITKAAENPGGVGGIAVGLRDLDAKIGGLHPSDLIILAGRPAMGKTALAIKIASGVCKSLLREADEAKLRAPEGAVAIFSLEMSADQLSTRMLSEEARVSGEAIRRGNIGKADFDSFLEASKQMSRMPMFIDDTPAISLSAMRTRCRRLKRKEGLSLIVVDYLQLMKPSPGARSENRVQEISAITQGLKALAKEMECPVIALSQLSRAVEQREDKRPQLADLRESGSIEQDADSVWFVYREEYYLGKKQPMETNFDSAEKYQVAAGKWRDDMERVHNCAELIIGKNRHGSTGIIPLYFEANFTRFGDMAHENPYYAMVAGRED